MTRNSEYEARSEAKAAWSVVVVYEDTAAREQAVDFCDQLVKRFWARFEFEVSWWSFSLLQKDPVAMEAAEKAAQADLVILSSLRQEDLPVPVKGWIESWLSRRGDREGILAGLMGPGVVGSGLEAPKHLYLRQVAHRGAMDYLTQVPQNISRSIPESLDLYTTRAAQVTNVLNEILHQQAPLPVMT
jgi:hypothetical protein